MTVPAKDLRPSSTAAGVPCLAALVTPRRLTLETVVVDAQANTEESQRCDAILMERKQKEMETEELERKIREFLEAEKEKLSHLPPDLQRTYGELQDNQKRLIADEDKLRLTFNNVCMQLAQIEEDVNADRNKRRLTELQAQKMALQERVMKLEKDVNKPALSETEMREQLLEQVKKDKESTATYERNSAGLEQRIKQAEEELEKLESGGSQADAEDAKKYQKLQEKDQEMTEFIEKFDDTFKKESVSVKDLEQRIVQVPNRVSVGVSLCGHTQMHSQLYSGR